jgi:hypothetical protein
VPDYSTHRDVIKGIIKNVYNQNLKQMIEAKYAGADYTVDDLKRVKKKIFDAALGEYHLPLEVMAITCLELADFYLKEADRRKEELQERENDDKNYVAN